MISEGVPRVCVLGVDPGPSSCGACILSFSRAARPELAEKRIILSDTGILDRVIRGSNVSICALEVPIGHVHEHARGAALLATARVAGLIAGLCSAAGVPCIELSAAEWRRALCGRVSPSDATVKRAIEIHVAGWPKRSNAHERDAAGVAVVGMRKYWQQKGRAA